MSYLEIARQVMQQGNAIDPVELELHKEREAIQAVEREAEAAIAAREQVQFDPQAFHEEQAEDTEQPQEAPVGSPCSCGSLMFWWDGNNRQHCLECDPPIQSERLMELAARLKQQPKRKQKNK